MSTVPTGLERRPGLSLTACFRLFILLPLLAALTIVLMPFQLGLLLAWNRGAGHLACFWHRFAVFVAGARIAVHGRIPPARPLLIVANHVSWFDIVAFGSLAPVHFIAKSEIRRWPIVNLLAAAQRTIYVNRNRRGEIGGQAEMLARRLRAGDAMLLFAEGTTGTGHRIGQFKSSLLAALPAALNERGTATVLPVAIAYTKLHGLPLGRLRQARASWPGEVPLLPHLLSFLKSGGFDVEISFGEPFEVTCSHHRKLVAHRARAAVRQEFAGLMRMSRHIGQCESDHFNSDSACSRVRTHSCDRNGV